jgi:hypothetical protein
LDNNHAVELIISGFEIFEDQKTLITSWTPGKKNIKN